MSRLSWFYANASTLTCWVKARSMEEATSIAIRAMKDAYNFDASYSLAISTSDKPPSSLVERDEIHRNVYWYK